LYIAIPLVVIGFLAAGTWLVAQRRPASAATPEEVRAEIIPQAGDPTAYGLPLSLDNTQRFIDYYETTSLTAEQERIKEDALLPLKAPCCDDNPMSTCCCDCNLAKSVWGLSGYLAAEKGFETEQVQASALQWLRFISSDYYVGQELASRGVNPDRYDLPRGDGCYTGRCELPFGHGGCGGMGVLRQ
jgi:hypothetical protein